MPELHGSQLPAKEGVRQVFDATGSNDSDICPRCGSDATITYHYTEGFEELECSACGFMSDAAELSDLQRFDGALKESDEGTGKTIPVPRNRMIA